MAIGLDYRACLRRFLRFSEHPFLAVINCPVEDQLHGCLAMWVLAQGRVSDDIEKQGTPNRGLKSGMEKIVFHPHDVLVAVWNA